MTANEPTPPTEVHNNEAERRYELKLAGRVVGVAEYRPAGKSLMFTHTEIEEGHEGQGLGSTLVRAALDDARARKVDVVPMCPFVAAFIREHHEYLELVQPQQRGMFGL
ncbi:GNAT family N-acetyltransferase [Deinococcus aquatilis]|jgi:predicted GNAT family acetyltransferase|uniref:GNAT family N-acetyltransferase n=1 Tax=Deinococcus aquatilis TaxID=519440 RepID=UPI00035E3318|nr:GNAT family N-acetyltransferase [Deinococcus aquatilis]